MNAHLSCSTPNSDERDTQPPTSPTSHPRRHWGGPVVGGFYLSMGGVHIGLVAADTSTYRHFADAALFPFVRDGWQNIFMAHPTVFGLLLAAGEITSAPSSCAEAAQRPWGG